MKSKSVNLGPLASELFIPLMTLYHAIVPSTPARDQVPEMVADPLTWLQNHTRTKDSHWREAGAPGPYRPFPAKPYFRPVVENFQAEPVLLIEKSRDMMLSWLCVGLFTHAAMTTPGIEILLQSQKEDKAFELVEYAKTLYDQQPPELQKAFSLAKKLNSMADGLLEFANGSLPHWHSRRRRPDPFLPSVGTAAG